MNIKTRLSRILLALSRSNTSDGDTSTWRMVPDAKDIVHLPPDATPGERLLFEQIRSMYCSVLPPSYVTSFLFVED